MSQEAIAFVFPGQGSQFVGMGRELATFPDAQQLFAQADEVLGLPLSRLCFEGPEAELNDTINTQPAIVAHSIATLRVIESRTGLKEQLKLVAGHSLGEFSALVCAGALSFADALRLVRERGRLMKQAGEQHPGAMAAILNLDRAKLDDICAEASRVTDQPVQVANDNCPGQIVISGDKAALDKAMELAKARGARRCIPLAVSIAAHSPLMAGAAQEFRAALESAQWADPRPARHRQCHRAARQPRRPDQPARGTVDLARALDGIGSVHDRQRCDALCRGRPKGCAVRADQAH